MVSIFFMFLKQGRLSKEYQEVNIYIGYIVYCTIVCFTKLTFQQKNYGHTLTYPSEVYINQIQKLF